MAFGVKLLRTAVAAMAAAACAYACAEEAPAQEAAAAEAAAQEVAAKEAPAAVKEAAPGSREDAWRISSRVFKLQHANAPASDVQGTVISDEYEDYSHLTEEDEIL